MNTLLSLSLLCVAFGAAACTANVKDPVVNQGGQTNEECTADCDEVEVNCNAECNDDGCRVTCVKDHDDCKTVCEGG